MQSCPLCGETCEVVNASVDIDGQWFLFDGGNIHLTPKEAQFLERMIDASPRTVSKGYLMDSMYGLFSEKEEPDNRILNVYAYKLRKKLVATPFRLLTIWGGGGFRLVRVNKSEGSEQKVPDV